MPRVSLALAIAALLAFAAPAVAQVPGGITSDNVQFVKNFIRHTDTSGAKLVGGYYYVTTERDLSIYDVKDPENPVLVGNVLLATPGEPTFPEEDVDTNGKILVVSNTDFFVYDVSDKANPHLIGTLPGVDQHTLTCVLDCTWVYGSAGAVVDLRDPTQPKLAGSWNDAVTPQPTTTHDVTEVSPGILVTSTAPLLMLDARADPLHPIVLATGKTPGFAHGNLWPHLGSDDFLLVGGEEIGPGCANGDSSTFMTFDARNWQSTKTFSLISEYRMSTGMVVDGRMVDSSWCTHWFQPNPTYANGGLVGIAWYEQGTRFLKIDAAGKIEEIGWYLPISGQASDIDWVTDRVAYIADYLRGVDIVRFTGAIPPGFPKGAAPTTRTPATRSRTRPSFDRLVSLPSQKRCARVRSFRVGIRINKADPVVRATLRVDGRIVATARGARLKKGLRARRLPRGRFSVQVQVSTKSGFKTAGARSYRRCG